MGKEKLVLAAEAAGYAMVYADDCEILTSPSDSKTSSQANVPDSQETRTIEARTISDRLSAAQDWLGSFTARPVVR